MTTPPDPERVATQALAAAEGDLLVAAHILTDILYLPDGDDPPKGFLEECIAALAEAAVRAERERWERLLKREKRDSAGDARLMRVLDALRTQEKP